MNDEQKLCISCGLCCDGTLFNRAIAKPEEPLLPKQDELLIGGERFFKLPCHYFDGLCTVYDQRPPNTCGSFKCEVLNDAISGKVTYNEAEELVGKIRQQKKRLLKLIPNASSFITLAEAMIYFREQHERVWTSVEFRKQYSTLLMEWVGYQARLERFRKLQA